MAKSSIECAIDLIKVYVERGDTYDSLRAGQQGHLSSDYCASIGGFIDNKKYDAHHIIITRIGKEKVNHVFKLKDIINEIKNPSKQVSLL